jgi:hypothetical protein
VARIVTTGRLATRKKRERLLAQLREQRRSCSYEKAVAALKAWGFIVTRRPGNPSQAWTFRNLRPVSFHKPHGKDDMDRGAIAGIISAIEEAQVLLPSEDTTPATGGNDDDENA